MVMGAGHAQPQHGVRVTAMCLQQQQAGGAQMASLTQTAAMASSDAAAALNASAVRA